MVYLKYVENVITLGKLIGLLFLFCLPLLSILFFKTNRNDLARPVMGTIFLVQPVCCIINFQLHKQYRLLGSGILSIFHNKSIESLSTLLLLHVSIMETLRLGMLSKHGARKIT